MHPHPLVPHVVLWMMLSVLVGCDLLDPIFGGGDSAPGTEPVFLELPGEDLFPEGILATEGGDLFVSGFGNGAIVQVTGGANTRLFKKPGEDGLVQAVGMAVDEARGRLWVANFDGQTGQSNLKVFDLASGALLATLAPEPDGQPHFFNELAIDDEGRVYVSDTVVPALWTAGPDLDAVEVFVTDPALANPDPNRPFGLNGLALTPDGQYLVASIMDRITPGGGRLVRVDVATQAVTEIELTGASETVAGFGGSDGMFFEPGGLLVMVNVTPPGPIAAIVTAAFSEDYTAAELVGRTPFDDVYNRPTASALREGRLWTVNSQLDHLIDDENGALGTPPDLPFRLVHVPLDETLGR